MNAKEFIQKFGWNDARVCILNCACPEDRWFMRHGDLVSDQDFDDLKRLVESHELVETWKLPEDDENGLDGATLYLECYAFYSTDEEKAKLDRLAQAIADVESCMEVSSESN